MDFYKHNIESIKEKRNNLYYGIMKYEVENAEHNQIKVTSLPTKDGNATVSVFKDNQECRLNSLYQPIKEAQKWASQFQFHSLGIVISMYGLGNGIFLRELINQKGKEDLILVYEPSPQVFLHVLKHYDITDLLNNKQIIISVDGLNEKDFLDELGNAIHWTNIGSQIVCMHPQYEKLFLESSKRFFETINENNNRTLINRNTMAFFSKDIVENTIKNIKFVQNANTVLDLVDEFPHDVPAIIVSAGPSLDKNIDLLKEAKGKAVIVATDTAVKFLYAHDIVPDFFVTLDAMKPENYLDDPRFMSVPLFTKVEGNWRILHKHKARKIYYSCQSYLNQIFKKLGKLISNYTSGGSVATGAFSVCAAMQFKTIVLIGQDLAFTGDRTHAGGHADHIHGEEEGIRYVEGIDGQPVKTRHDWYLYLQWFENAIQEIKHTTNVIDATEGGAKIHGSKIMTLREVIDQYCTKEIDCAAIMTNKQNTLSEDQVNRVYEYLKEGINELKQIEDNSAKAIATCEQILSGLKNQQVFDEKLMKKASKLEELNKAIEGLLVYHLIDEYISDISMQTLMDIYKFTNDEMTDRVNTFKRAYAFYQAVNSAAIAICPMLQEAIDDFWNLDSTREEVKDQRVVLIMQMLGEASSVQGNVSNGFSGKMNLEHQIERLRQVKHINELVIATTEKEQDDKVVKEGQRLGAKVYRGSEYDILTRYYFAAKENRADIIVRVSSDCSSIDPQQLDQMIEYYKDNTFDIVNNYGENLKNNSYPSGLEIEVFSYQKLREAYQYAKESEQRGKVTPYLYEKGKVGYLLNNK